MMEKGIVHEKHESYEKYNNLFVLFVSFLDNFFIAIDQCSVGYAALNSSSGAPSAT